MQRTVNSPFWGHARLNPSLHAHTPLNSVLACSPIKSSPPRSMLKEMLEETLSELYYTVAVSEQGLPAVRLIDPDFLEAAPSDLSWFRASTRCGSVTRPCSHSRRRTTRCACPLLQRWRSSLVKCREVEYSDSSGHTLFNHFSCDVQADAA